ncbi:hypothetical protein E2C01_000584 [Portunus trituberculatus]|uniref:Uncharacterized protein n=1 Tax=Portunus trituberculatus TaxID=210409 RepID=A0A5B7CFH2_PORTR|nr:hypothetical protein [Portunus trituberculatus]
MHLVVAEGQDAHDERRTATPSHHNYFSLVSQLSEYLPRRVRRCVTRGDGAAETSSVLRSYMTGLHFQAGTMGAAGTGCRHSGVSEGGHSLPLADHLAPKSGHPSELPSHLVLKLVIWLLSPVHFDTRFIICGPRCRQTPSSGGGFSGGREAASFLLLRHNGDLQNQMCVLLYPGW